VDVIIRSESGSEVYRTTMKSVMAGEHEFSWDGKNNAGKDMEKGVYSVEVVPKNGDSTGQALTFITGVAQRVQFSADGVYLMLDDVSVAIGNIEEVGSVEGD
jgi:flagellar basal-body rod modification protein FlgD